MNRSCTAAIWYATHACEQVTRMCTSTHVEMKAHTKGLDVIFMFFQLLCAESLPAGCVWSRCDAIHQTEEGRSHRDPAASVLSAWCHPLAHSPLPLCLFLPRCHSHYSSPFTRPHPSSASLFSHSSFISCAVVPSSLRGRSSILLQIQCLNVFCCFVM